MAKYDLLQDFGGQEATKDGRIQQDAYWIIALVRYAHPLTFSRTKLIDSLNSKVDVSWDGTQDAITQTKPLMVITHDCVKMEIAATKNTHTTTLQASLVNSKTNYLSDVMPGDWVMAWIVNSRQQYIKTLKKIKNLETANNFEDGFKFMGRVHDLRKTLNQSPEGYKTVGYQLQAVGFEELDSEIFYDPHLAMRAPSIGQYLARFNISLSDIFNVSSAQARDGRGGIDSNLAIPVLIKSLIGKGIPSSFANLGGLPLVTGLTASDDAPFGYAVPNEIGKLLGVSVKSKGAVFSYADLLDVTICVQKYTNQNFPNMFFPNGTENDVGKDVVNTAPELLQSQQEFNRHHTDTPLRGTFLPMPIEFNGKTIWTLLNEYLNPVINEMYTSFKLCPNGRVMPALVVRQLPFSTPTIKAALDQTLGITSFLEVPRWSAPPILIKSMDTGRSNNRFNFLHVYGQSAAAGGLSITQQMVLNPPYRDDTDIKRNGLKLYMSSTNCSIQDTVHGPRVWMTILADFVMGQHLMLNGGATLAGISSPIVPGDNFEFDDVVYHIESVQHVCSLSPDGKTRTFYTNLTLSHGIRSDIPVSGRVPPKHTVTKSVTQETDNSFLDINPSARMSTPSPFSLSQSTSPKATTYEVTDDGQNPDLYVYSGVAQEDNTKFNPGLVSESEDD